MKPTYLYIKIHGITGMRYFGKTTRHNPQTYKGSGKYWLAHINKHGKEHVQTLWISDPFTDAQLLLEFASFFSEELNIVNSLEWANLRAENGYDGAPVGVVHPETVTSRFKNPETNPSGVGEKNPFFGKQHTDEQKEKWSKMRLGELNPNYQAKSFTEKTQNLLRRPKSNKQNYKGTPGKITCIDRCGNTKHITTKEYHDQKINSSDPADWEYVNTRSKEAQKRKEVK